MAAEKNLLESVSHLFDSIRNLFPHIRLRHFAYTVLFVFAIMCASLFIFESLTGYFYFRRVENRVQTIEVLASIDQKRLKEDPQLYSLYTQILKELQAYQIRSVTSVPFEIPTKVLPNQRILSNILKFIAGAALWIILALAMMSTEDQQNRIAGALFLFGIGLLLGIIGAFIPSISPWINYIGYPVGQIAVIGLIVGIIKLFTRRDS